MFQSTPGCAVGPWLVTGMGTEWKQGCWMLTASYHVVGSDAGCMRCLTMVGLTLGAYFLSWVLFPCFSFSFVETLLVHWAHGIEDSNTLDVVRDDYLFGSARES